MFENSTHPERIVRAKAFIAEGLIEDKLKLLVAKTFPLAQIVEAQRYMESNQQIGKIVLIV